ncbi:MAG: VOC family protein, partial [Acidimicrobiia bacterium]
DVEAGKDFYGDLFGWQAIDGDGGESMPYTMFTLDGNLVAGMGPLSPDQIDAGQPPVWSAYIIVDDADATFAAAVEGGATPIMEPMEIMDSGRMFFVFDPTGAAVGFWQPGTHGGAQVFNVHGAMTWNDLGTRDADAAKEFYTGLLNWNTSEMPMGEGVYTTFQVGDRMNGGMFDISGHMPDEIPAHWLTWFLVDDCEAAAARVTELGGSVQRPPSETGVGISSVVSDPWGATFGIIQSDQADGQPPR